MNHTQSGNQSAPAPKFCTKCGNSLAPGVKFCTKCGAPVLQAVPPQEPVVQAAPPQEPADQAAPPQELVVQAAPPQEPADQAAPPQEPVVQAAPPQEPADQAARPQEPSIQAAPPQRPPVRQGPPQGQQEKPPKKKKKSFVKYLIIVLVCILLIAVLALLALKMLADRGFLQIPDEYNYFNFFQADSSADKSEEDKSSGDDSGEPPDSSQEGVSSSSPGEEADYDVNVWDSRFPAPPASVHQQYYVIYYEGSRNNRIDMAVFNLDGALNGNYLLWDKTGGAIALKDYNAMTECSRYFYDGNTWVKDADNVRWISDAASNVISSNLDIHDWDSDRLYLSHITSAGISTPIDYSYYQPAAGEYALPGSDSRYLVKADLSGFTADECRIARNEIYARHGRMFADADLQAYFNQFGWYEPRIRPEDFSDAMLNEYETANLALIIEYETEMRYR